MPTTSSKFTGDLVAVRYGRFVHLPTRFIRTFSFACSGYFVGAEFTDTVTLSEDLVIENQSIGVAFLSGGFAGYDGILGLGPVNLTVGTLLPNTGESVPTVTDNLFAQKKINCPLLGIFFEPTTPQNATGQLDFGGIDRSKISEEIHYVPITETRFDPSQKFTIQVNASDPARLRSIGESIKRSLTMGNRS